MASTTINTPPEAAIGLDLFAAAWLERWNSYGGSVHIDLEGNSSGTFLPEPSVDDAPDPLWSGARHSGATRELLALLDLVPGGWDALKAHVCAFPVQFSRGRVCA